MSLPWLIIMGSYRLLVMGSCLAICDFLVPVFLKYKAKMSGIVVFDAFSTSFSGSLILQPLGASSLPARSMGR